MVEANGPTIGELGRRLDRLSEDLISRINQLDSRLERFASLAVDSRLNDVDRRLTGVEKTLATGATQRSSATWQALFLVLGVLGSMAVGVLMALLFGGGK